jgi:hypothetical protein
MSKSPAPAIERSYAWQDKQYARSSSASQGGRLPVVSVSLAGLHDPEVVIHQQQEMKERQERRERQDEQQRHAIISSSLGMGNGSNPRAIDRLEDGNYRISPAYRAIPDYSPGDAGRSVIRREAASVDEMGPPPMAHGSYVLSAEAERAVEEREIRAAAEDDARRERVLAELERREQAPEADSAASTALRDELARSQQRILEATNEIRSRQNMDWDGMNAEVRDLRDRHMARELSALDEWQSLGESLRAASQGISR